MISSVGISQIGVAIPKYFLSVKELARERKLPIDYAKNGLGLRESRIPYQTSLEKLAREALLKIDFHDAGRFYIGTESDPDISKPMGIKILNKVMGNTAIPFQYKCACLGGLQALISACEYSIAHRGKPAVVLVFDRSLYSEDQPKAELTQGCAAIALRVEKNPKILALDYERVGEYAVDIDDFKVPASSFPFPQINGQLTKIVFLGCQNKALENWKKRNQCFFREKKKNFLEEIAFFVVHTPFPKMIEWMAATFWQQEKGKRKKEIEIEHYLQNPLLFLEYKKEIDKIRKRLSFQKFFAQKFKPALRYNCYIGNAYTASIFISLLAVLEKAKKNDKVSIHGFGSGANALCLRGIVTLEGKFKSDLERQLKKGKKLTIKQYLKWRQCQ